jgi:replicative DNA helicase
MRWEAPQTALKNISVATFNLENDQLEYAKFAISALTHIDSSKLKNPRLLTPAELESVRNAANTLKNLPWRIITLARPTVNEVDRIARKLFAQSPFELGQLDYIQLISNNLNNRVEDLSITTATLRAMALRSGKPWMAASQFSRNIEYRGDNAEPKLADLRESGSLEQDATQVWAPRSLWGNPPTEEQVASSRFPENFDRRTGLPLPIVSAIPMRVFILKNRNGPIGLTDPIKWVKSTGEFLTLQR